MHVRMVHGLGLRCPHKGPIRTRIVLLDKGPYGLGPAGLRTDVANCQCMLTSHVSQPQGARQRRLNGRARAVASLASLNWTSYRRLSPTQEVGCCLNHWPDLIRIEALTQTHPIVTTADPSPITSRTWSWLSDHPCPVATSRTIMLAAISSMPAASQRRAGPEIFPFTKVPASNASHKASMRLQKMITLS